MTSGAGENLDVLRREAEHAMRDGRWPEAQASLERVLERAPDDHAARLELARVLLGLGQLRAAVEQLLRIASSCPDDALLLAKLVPLLQRTGEVNAARQCLDRLDRCAPSVPALLHALAGMRRRLGEIEAAKDAMDRAMAAGADGPDALYMHALMHQFTGNLDAAERALRDCLERWPGFGSVAVVLANLRRQDADSGMLEYLDGLRSRLPPESASPQARKVHAEYASARFKVLDDLDRTDEAWVALEHSNALMSSLFAYDAEAEVALTDAVIDVAANTRADEDNGNFGEGPVPIFIVGLPRSGSTLLERMLSAHSQVASAGEIDDLLCQLHWMADVPQHGTRALIQAIGRSSRFDHGLLGRRYLEQTRWRARGRGYFVDKMLANVRMVPLIRRALPQAPILHVVREPMDVCFSNLKIMFGPSSPHTYDMQAMAHYHAQYRRLLAHYARALPGAILDVRYDDLVRDPDATMRRVLAHCGLQPEPACLHPEENAVPVATRSSVQVREAIHGRGLDGWKRYAGPLQPLRQALQAV